MTATPTSPGVPTTITNLPAAGIITGSELIAIVQNGVTVRTTAIALSTGLGGFLPSGDIIVGNASNVASPVPLGGDAILSDTGALTIEKIQGTAISGTTGTGDVVFSNSPIFTGEPSGPTASPGTNTTQFATTAFVETAVGSFTPPTQQIFLSSTGTYTTPANCKYIKVRMIGGGGGGSGSGTSGGSAGGAGGDTTFGTSLLVAGGGNGGLGGATTLAGGTGGTASIGAGSFGLALQGASGSGNSFNTTGFTLAGAPGAGSPFSGPTMGAYWMNNGQTATQNTGCGGQGGPMQPVNTVAGGAGGGAGGYIEAQINTPATTYAYAVGTAGVFGANGTSGTNGGSGGSGIIIVYEYYS